MGARRGGEGVFLPVPGLGHEAEISPCWLLSFPDLCHGAWHGVSPPHTHSWHPAHSRGVSPLRGLTGDGMRGGGWLRPSLQREGHQGAEIPQQELRVGLSTLPTPFLPWGRLSPCPPFPRCSPLRVGPPEGRGGMRVGRQLCGEGVPRPFLGGHTERWVVWPPAAGGFGGVRRRCGAGAGCVGGCGVARPHAPAATALLCPQAVCGGDRVPLLLRACGGTGVTPRGWEGVPGAATGPLLAWFWDPAAPPACGLGHGLGASLGLGAQGSKRQRRTAAVGCRGACTPLS